IHAESTGGVEEAIHELADRVEIGLALNIETPIVVLAHYANKIQFVQCMGITHVGFQGQVFDTRVIEKIKAIKATYPALIISVDGGVSLETAPLLIQAGADRLIVGSAIFGSANFVEAISHFKAITG
ncbi:MAG: ribulose-phosphate 3-epimerase, partial [Candidatus Taylorbacteria bacterium]